MLTRKPVAGDVVRWAHGYEAVVERTPEAHEDICRIRGVKDGRESSFIWRHPEGLNTQAEIVR